MSEPRPDAPHGTRARYYHRREPCRCPYCRAANAAYIARRRALKPRAVIRRRQLELPGMPR